MARPPFLGAVGELAPGAVTPEQPNRTRFARRLRRDYSWTVAFFVIGIIVVSAVLAPVLSPADPLVPDLSIRLHPPAWVRGGTWIHPLGTDQLGRDVLSRLLYGGRTSLAVILSAVTMAGVAGTTLGLVAGYVPGWVSVLVSRAADAQLAFPFIMLALAFLAILGPSLVNLAVVLSLWVWVPFARVTRSETLVVREHDYIEAARALGARHARIIVRHVMPNVLSSILVVWALTIGQVIVAEAALSFLGFGVPLPHPSWGSMLSDGQGYLASAWWLALFPGLLITSLVLSFNTIAVCAIDRLNPRPARHG